MILYKVFTNQRLLSMSLMHFSNNPTLIDILLELCPELQEDHCLIFSLEPYR